MEKVDRTDLKNRLAYWFDRVAFGGVIVKIERRSRPSVYIISEADFQTLLRAKGETQEGRL